MFLPISNDSFLPIRPTTYPVTDASSSQKYTMLLLTISIIVLGFAILAFFAYSLSQIIRSARKQNKLSQSVEDCLETARILESSSQPQTYGTISSATLEMPQPHSEVTENTTKTIIPRNSSTTLRAPSICDGLSNISSASVTRASSITIFHCSDTERSDTPTVPSDSVGVIQDLELEIKDSRKENHKLCSALEVALKANAVHLQTISEMVNAVGAGDEVNRELVQQIERLQNEKTELADRMETAVSEMNRLADVNDEMIKSIDVRNRNNAVVEANGNILRQQVKKLRDEKDETSSSQRDLEQRLEEAKLDAEVKRKILVRKTAKLEREKASLGADFNALNQQNAELKRQAEELNQQNVEFLEQHTISQEEYASLLEYTQDLQQRHNQLASDRAARAAEAAIVIPKPLDYSELGRANVKLLEKVAALEVEKQASAVQLDDDVEGDTYDGVQQCAMRVYNVCPAIGSARQVSPAISMSAQVEQLEAIADALAKEEKHTPSVAITGCSPSTEQVGNPTSSSISVVIAPYDMANSAPAEEEAITLLQTLEQRVIMRLCAPPAEPASPFHLPFTPLALSYQNPSATKPAEDTHDESGEESDILGTPPQALVSLPSATEIFGPHADAPQTREFRLAVAPPCHLDAYTSEWVHEEGLEEDLDAEDVFTPSPTMWCVADVDPEEVYARNREAAYESGEIF